MGIFHWNKSFETGLDEVDEQHQVLVDLINRLDEALMQKDRASRADVEAVFNELMDYTHYHFQDEEAMMTRVGLDPRFLSHHVQLHAAFLEEAVKMRAVALGGDLGAAKSMLNFLVHWLAFHIFGVDQSMFRQVVAVQAGQAASAVFEEELRIAKVATEPLLSALNVLFQQVAEQNRELLEFNLTLESRVAERTRDLDQANQRLEEMAMTDALTGLPNRRHAMARLAREWQDSVTNNTSLACMMIDADGFKRINDTYGHEAGDVVLRELARRLRFAMRSDDIVCRLGGDEFFIICPNTPIGGALQVAEIMRASVAALRVPAGDGEWNGSVSVGVAARLASMQSIEELMKVADDGVYKAKRAGRNCVATCMDI